MKEPTTSSTTTAAAQHVAIADIPLDERPRERLLRAGSGSLTDSELLAVLLRTGRPGASALDLARELLEERQSLDGLVGVEAAMLRRHGLGPAKTATVMAAVEIGRRLAQEELPERDPMRRPSEVARYLRLRYACPDQEVMGALFLDARNGILAERELYRGTLARATVEPRLILKEALVRNAAAVLVFHNHPSGNPAPSLDDMVFTRRLAIAAAALGVRLVDHMILAGASRWSSLQQMGLCKVPEAVFEIG